MKNERSLSGVLEKMSEVLSEALKMNGNLQTVYCGAEQEPNRSRSKLTSFRHYHERWTLGGV